ncbi:metallophosphoesterase [Ekhidna sp.]|uniref:metallophosphoesterase n=1 Tax=Ekhidna sp. TaxID=2608089 RepID=UPI00329A6DFD
MMKRTFVMGDIHGNLRAFDQCMERCQFDADRDILIQLGDVSDRQPETAMVVERLLKIKNMIAIRGNHDEWTSKWISSGKKDSSWLSNGGQETIDSYHELNIDPLSHQGFFDNQVLYHTDAKNRIFVHGGFTQSKGPNYDLIKTQCLWDRSLWNDAMIGERLKGKPHILSGYDEIFIGHTPTLTWSITEPMKACNVWNLDTGAGHPTGRLSIMDVDTKEYWQSDLTNELYV